MTKWPARFFKRELKFDCQGAGKKINGSKFASFEYEYQFDIHDIDNLNEVNKDNT